MNSTLPAEKAEWLGQGVWRYMAELGAEIHWGDMLARQPGGVIRVRNPQQLQAMHSEPESNTFGCVAGWISEED